MPVQWEQFVPAGGGPIGGDFADDVGDVGLRLEVVHLCRLDDRVDHGGALAAGPRAGEQPILPTDRDGADRPFGDVVVDLETAVVEEASERLPALGAIADGLGRRRFGRELSEGVVRRDQQSRPRLADASSNIGGLTANLGYDRVELADAVEQVSGE